MMGQLANRTSHRGATKAVSGGLKVINPSKRTLKRREAAERKRAEAAGFVETLPAPLVKHLSERTKRHHRRLERLALDAAGAKAEAAKVVYEWDKSDAAAKSAGSALSLPASAIGGVEFVNYGAVQAGMRLAEIDPERMALDSLIETLGCRGVMQLIRRSLA